MAKYGSEITNYYAPYRYDGSKPSLVGGAPSNKPKPKYTVQPGQSVSGGSRGMGEGGGRGER